MVEAGPVGRGQAIRILERGRIEIDALIREIPNQALTTPGLGGGLWSPKDLVGHLASWEEHALDAVAAWERGERAPIDDLGRMLSNRAINDQNVSRKSGWSFVRVQRGSRRTHEELIDAIRRLDVDRWTASVGPRGRRPLWQRLGGILSGPGGPFRHDESHLPTLADFVSRHCRR
jgi:Mycothiol maleylpyruvate isomerase N-terminal domain